MKVEFITRPEEAIEEFDFRDAVRININGECVFRVSDGEPEDSNLSRDFSDVYKISELLNQAYDAGAMGEDFDITYLESENA